MRHFNSLYFFLHELFRLIVIVQKFLLNRDEDRCKKFPSKGKNSKPFY